MEGVINKIPDGTLVKKAYDIDFDRIEEGYMFDSGLYILYAENRNEAKSELLKEFAYSYLKLKWGGDEVTYLNIPVIRMKEFDKVMFEDKTVKRFEIDNILEERERLAKLDEILNRPDIKYCYIKKGSYYRPNSCGYTSHKTQAGVYTKEEAVSSAKNVREISVIPIDIEEYNKLINDEINELKTRLI